MCEATPVVAASVLALLESFDLLLGCDNSGKNRMSRF